MQALRRVSYDMSLQQPLELIDGTTVTALDVQWELYDRARKYADANGLDCVGEAAGDEVLQRWESVLTALETDPMSLADQLDWVAKFRMIEGFRERHGVEWDDPKVAALDLQYHDLRPSKSLFARLGVERVLAEDEVEAAVTDPPPGHQGVLPGHLPAPLGRRASWPPTGTRWCSTSASTRSVGCR